MPSTKSKIHIPDGSDGMLAEIELLKSKRKKIEKDFGRLRSKLLNRKKVSKINSKVDLWLKDVAPSDELRKWFSHDPEKWADFKMKYKKELRNKLDLLRKVEQIEKEKGIITLLYSAKDQEHNNAVVLQEILQHR